MSLASDYSLPATAPAVMDWRAWLLVPVAIREAYWRQIGDKDAGGGTGEQQRALESGYTGTVTKAALLAAVPLAQAPAVPAPDNPTIRTWGDLYRAFSDEQVNVFLAMLARAYGANKRTQAEQALAAGTYAERRADMLRFVAFRLAYVDKGFRPAGVLVRASTLAPLTQARELGQLNLALASRWAGGMVEPGEGYAERRAALRAFAIANEGNPAATDLQLAAVAAARISELFTAQGIALDDAMEAQRALPVAPGDVDARAAASAQMVGSAIEANAVYVTGAQGIGDSLKRLFRQPLQFVRNVMEEIGKGAQALADNILRTDKTAPWLATFLLKPLGFFAQAEILSQLGAVLIDGSISAFDEVAVAKSGADTFTAAGRALLIAAPFLPVPYNVAAAAIGAASVAAGTAINRAIADQQASRKVEAAKQAAQAAAVAAGAEAETIKQEIAALEAQAEGAKQTAAEAATDAQVALLAPTPAATGPQQSTGPPRWFLPVAAGVALVIGLSLFGGKGT